MVKLIQVRVRTVLLAWVVWPFLLSWMVIVQGTPYSSAARWMLKRGHLLTEQPGTGLRFRAACYNNLLRGCGVIWGFREGVMSKN